MQSGRSLMYTRNSKGPNTVPSLLTLIGVDVNPLYITICMGMTIKK